MARDKGRLGKLLIRRARALVQQEKNKEKSKTEEDKIKDMDQLEDIFVGSGSQSADKIEASGSRRDNDRSATRSGNKNDESITSGENEKGSGNGDEGGMGTNVSADTSSSGEEQVTDQHDLGSGSSQGFTNKYEDQTSAVLSDSTSTGSETENRIASYDHNEEQTVISSGSGRASLEKNLALADSTQEADQTTAVEASGKEQTGSGVSTQPVASGEDKAGLSKPEELETSKKSDIQSSGDSEEDSSGSAEVIRKGMESLSRLLSPVASGYHFELYSGNSPQTKAIEVEGGKAMGESDVEQVNTKIATKDKTKSDNKKAKNSKKENDIEEESEDKDENELNEDEMEPVKEKVCRKECHLPMTYEQCAVPRCAKKMGSIKDLCYWLCEHQNPVCEQKCEYIERS